MKNGLRIEFRQNLIASEMVFPPMERTGAHCFRFVLNCYLYNKTLSLTPFFKAHGIPSSKASRHYGHGDPFYKVKHLSYEQMELVCKFYNININAMLFIMKQFQFNTEYNSIDFKDDGTVIFNKAFLVDWGF